MAAVSKSRSSWSRKGSLAETSLGLEGLNSFLLSLRRKFGLVPDVWRQHETFLGGKLRYPWPHGGRLGVRQETLLLWFVLAMMRKAGWVNLIYLHFSSITLNHH